MHSKRFESQLARFARVLLVLCSALSFLKTARAEPNDKQALALAKEAIEKDYLSTDFAKAKSKLELAIDMCKAESACSAKVRAHVHRELGVVLVAGLNDVNQGKKEFIEALRADPSIGLDRDLTTKEVEDAFNEARAEIGATGAPADETGTASATVPQPASSEPAAPGEMQHTPPAEQAVLTPVPLYVVLPEGVVASRVTVHYRPFGATEWKSVDMDRRKEGWGVEIPCLDVGNTTGDLSYYIIATDTGGDVAAFSGTRNAPYKVPIKTELAGDPPHLPGKPPPAQCQDVSDCPPGFPGCSRPESDHAEASEAVAAKNGVSLGIEQDLLFMPSAKPACGGGKYACFFEDPNQYYGGTPFAGSGNEISGGPTLATIRILAGYDRLLFPNLEVGGRLGFAFRGGPKAPGGSAFFPIHVEARVTYYFGTNPLKRKGLRPYVNVSGGMAQIDGRVLVPIYATETDYTAHRLADLAAWRRTGTGFIGFGGGLMYAITPASGPFLDLRLLEMLGASGTAVSPLLGYEVGF